MAQWNKIIVSGSDAVLKTATLSNGIAVGTQVISASQAGTQLSGSFTGSFKGDGSGLTGVSAAGTISSSAQIVWSQVNYNTGIVSSSTQVATLLLANTVSSSAQVTAFLPTGTVSSSTQFKTLTDPFTGSFTGSFVGAYTGSILAPGVVSASSQYPGWVTSSTQIVWSSVNYNTGIVSSSAQVAPLLPANTVSSSGQVIAFLPTGTVSSSTQFNTLTNPFTGSFTGSFTGDGSGLTGIATTLNVTGSTGTASINLKTQALTINGGNGITTNATDQTITVSAPAGTVSSSTQVVWASVNYSSGIVSSSAQVQPLLPGGTVSSSAQYPGWVTASNQVQLASITGTTFAASNFTFPQNLTVSGDLFVDGTTTTINTNNLNVEDRFILVNSGSVPGGSAQGGIIAQDGANPSGSAIFYTTAGSINRWGLADNVPWNATTATQTAYVAAVVDLSVAAQSSSLSTYAKVGNIRVDTNGDIYIYG
jgi:hypothetical protein